MEEDRRQSLKEDLEEDAALINKVQKILGCEKYGRLNEILVNDELFHEFKNASVLNASVAENKRLLPLTNVALTYSKIVNLQKLLEKEVKAQKSVEKYTGKEVVQKIHDLVKLFEGKKFVDDDVAENIMLYHVVRNIALKCVLVRISDIYSRPNIQKIMGLETNDIGYNDAIKNLKYLMTATWEEKMTKAEELSFELEFLKTILDYWQDNKIKDKITNLKTDGDIKSFDKNTTQNIRDIIENKKETYVHANKENPNDYKYAKRKDDKGTKTKKDISDRYRYSKSEHKKENSDMNNDEAVKSEPNIDFDCDDKRKNLNDKSNDAMDTEDANHGKERIARGHRNAVRDNNKKEYNSKIIISEIINEIINDIKIKEVDEITETKNDQVNTETLNEDEKEITPVKNETGSNECSLCSSKIAGNLAALVKHYSLEHFSDSIEEKYVPSWTGSCNLCKKHFGSKSDLIIHIGLDHNTVSLEMSNTKNDFQCHICRKEFKNDKVYKQHMILTHFNKQMTKEFLPSRSKSKCKFCAKEFPNKLSNLFHIGIYHNKIASYLDQMKCNSCDLTINSRFMKSHYVEKHFFEKMLNECWDENLLEIDNTCQLCQKVTKNEKELITHFAIEHNKILKFIDSTPGKFFKAHFKTEDDNEDTDTIVEDKKPSQILDQPIVSEAPKSSVKVSAKVPKIDIQDDEDDFLFDPLLGPLNDFTKELYEKNPEDTTKIVSKIEPKSDTSDDIKSVVKPVTQVKPQNKKIKSNKTGEITPTNIDFNIKRESALNKTSPVKSDARLKPKFVKMKSVKSSGMNTIVKNEENVELKNSVKLEAKFKPKFIKTELGKTIDNVLETDPGLGTTSDTLVKEAVSPKSAAQLKPKFRISDKSSTPVSILKTVQGTLIKSEKRESKSSSTPSTHLQNQSKDHEKISCKLCSSSILHEDRSSHYISKHYRKLSQSKLKKIQVDKGIASTKCPNESCLEVFSNEYSLIIHFESKHMNTGKKITNLKKPLPKITKQEKPTLDIPNKDAINSSKYSKTVSGQPLSIPMPSLQSKPTMPASQPTDSLYSSKAIQNPTIVPQPLTHGMPASHLTINTMHTSQQMNIPAPQQKPSPTMADLINLNQPTLGHMTAPQSLSRPITPSQPIPGPMTSLQTISTSGHSPSLVSKHKTDSPHSSQLPNAPRPSLNPMPDAQHTSQTKIPSSQSLACKTEETQVLCQPCKFIATSDDQLGVHRKSMGHKFKVIKNYSSSGNAPNRKCLICRIEFPQQSIFHHLETVHCSEYVNRNFVTSKNQLKSEPGASQQVENSKEKYIKEEFEKIKPENKQVGPYWFMQLKEFSDSRKETANSQAFQKSDFKFCNSSLLNDFFEKALIKDDNFTKFDEMIQQLGENGLSFEEEKNIWDLQIVKRYSLFNEYNSYCENLGTTIENCDILHIIIFLSQHISKPDVEWTIDTISKFHAPVNGEPLKADEKIVDYFEAMGITLGNKTKNSSRKSEKKSKVMSYGAKSLKSLPTNNNNMGKINKPETSSNDVVDRSQLKRKPEDLGNSVRQDGVRNNKKVKLNESISILSKNIEIQNDSIKDKDKPVLEFPPKETDVLKKKAAKRKLKTKDTETIAEKVKGNKNENSSNGVVSKNILDLKSVCVNVEDLAHSVKVGSYVRKRWKQMVIAGLLENGKYTQPRTCKRKACPELLEDALSSFKHIRIAHL